MSGAKVEIISPHFQHQNWVCLDPCTNSFTAAWLFQCLIVSIMNAEKRIRVELNGCNGLNMQTIESRVGLASRYEAPTFNTRIGCVWTLAPVSLQLDCSNVSL
eukprot:scaffold987_cov39-Cyclotella_meneghiniana.AAC.2